MNQFLDPTSFEADNSSAPTRIYDPEILSEFLCSDNRLIRSKLIHFLSEVPVILNDLDRHWARFDREKLSETASKLFVKVQLFGSFQVADIIRNFQRSLDEEDNHFKLAFWIEEIRQNCELLTGQVRTDFPRARLKIA